MKEQFEYLENHLRRLKQKLEDQGSEGESVMKEGQWREIHMLEHGFVSLWSLVSFCDDLSDNKCLITTFSDWQNFSKNT